MAGGMMMMMAVVVSMAMAVCVAGSDNNHAYSPCKDTRVQRHDGFTLGLAFAGKPSFNSSSTPSVQLSPCDKRLSLSSSNAQLAVFRPKVDEISLLTVNSSTLSPESYGAGYMVAFAGSKYAARSPLAFVANGSHIVTSFTLVLEFKKGRLNNLYWKRDSCASCKGNSNFVCLNGQDCAIPIKDCKSHQGKVDCSLGIQLAFSGTDKHYQVLNSWYEVSNLRQYSLFGLYSNLKNSLSSHYNNIL